MGKQQWTGGIATWCYYFLDLLNKIHKWEREASPLWHHLCLLLNLTFYLQCKRHCRRKRPSAKSLWLDRYWKKGEWPFISPRWEWILTLIYTVRFVFQLFLVPVILKGFLTANAEQHQSPPYCLRMGSCCRMTEALFIIPERLYPPNPPYRIITDVE